MNIQMIIGLALITIGLFVFWSGKDALVKQAIKAQITAIGTIKVDSTGVELNGWCFDCTQSNCPGIDARGEMKNYKYGGYSIKELIDICLEKQERARVEFSSFNNMRVANPDHTKIKYKDGKTFITNTSPEEK